MVSGTVSDTVQSECINRAVRALLSDADVRSMKRKAAISPNLFNGIYDYTCPTDLKGFAVCDIRPQVNRGERDGWTLTTDEEFDRMKATKSNIVAVSDSDMVRKLRLSTITDDSGTDIDTLDSVGSWAVVGDATNLTADTDNYVKGAGSLNFDINAYTSHYAGIVNSALTAFDLTDYQTGSVFVWAYISNATAVTGFTLKVGSGASDNYEITVTTTNEGLSFAAGWNLLRFDISGATINGTPDDDNCTYVYLTLNNNSTKSGQTDFRFDWLTLKKGNHYDVVYYSKYGWTSAAGTRLENSTADTDYLNLDTDEVDLIEWKAAEFMEFYLKNKGEAVDCRNNYNTMLQKYQIKHPSEALPLTTTYYEMPTDL